MQTEFIAVPPAWTVGRTIDHLRETPDLPDRFWEVYVAGAAGLLHVRLRSPGCCAPSGRYRSRA
jgi:Mg/Co/Ni transporter MgtE